MEFRRFDSHEAADKAEREYYRSLSPAERLDILLTLIANYREALPEAEQGLARVCRIFELGRD